MERLIVWHRWLPPPESTPEAATRAHSFAKRAESRFARDGAKVLARIGGTLVLDLEAAFAVQATEACLELQEAFGREREGDWGQLTHAITIGTLIEDVSTRTRMGDPLDRAQALANRARAGEVVLDAAAQTAAATMFLFAREVSAAPGVRGEAIDRMSPRRRACRTALKHLSPPSLPPSAQAQFFALKQVAQSTGKHRVLLVGPYGSGTNSWFDHLASDLKPPFWLHVSAVAAPLAPLSSLCCALSRRERADKGPAALLDKANEADARALDVLERVRLGQGVVRRDVISALRQWMLRAHEKSGKRAWITMSPLPLVDPATVSVIADATRDGAPDHLLVLRMAADTKPPQAFTRSGGLSEIRIPTLTQTEARGMAQSMLGKSTAHDIARRAAAMGGNTPLGIAEAVRMLVSSGDVIHERDKFVWRRGPAGRLSTLSADALLEERIDQLDADATRLLEILACVPDPSESDVVREVASLDGVPKEVIDSALDELAMLSLVDRIGASSTVSPTLRGVMERGMPPARLAELHRFVALALERCQRATSGFSRATLGYYLARGGRPEEAIEALLQVALSSGQLGFARSGLRLAAAAVECDPSPTTRQRAAHIAEALNERALVSRRSIEPFSMLSEPTGEHSLPVPEEPARPLGKEAVNSAIRAMISRDFDGVERAIDLMVAAGRDGPVVDRLRAMSALSKGDRPGALRVLERTAALAQDEKGQTPRALLTQALVALESNQLDVGTRQSLRALAKARAAHDIPGERAALTTLALFYRRLSRDKDAEALELAASSIGTLPRTTVLG